MKTYSILKSILMLSIAILLYGCSDNDDSFVLRSTDNLNFQYKESTQEFTVCTDGDWTVAVDADWLSVDKTSGTGDGVTREVVTVKALRNLGDLRTANITLNAAGKNLNMVVTQADGLMEMNNASFSGKLMLDKESEDCFISIPYKKGIEGDTFTFKTVLKGAGEGLVVEDVVVVLEESGTVVIPVKGVPQKTGDVVFEITAGSFTFETKGTVLNTIYFEEFFNLMLWGGDCVANKVGIKGKFTGSAPNTVIDPSQPETECSVGTDGSNDMFLTMAQSYRELRGMTSWTGKRVYERPGFIKMNTGSNVDGYLESLTFEELGISVGADVRVQFKYSQYYDDKGGILEVIVSGNGATSTTEFAMKDGSDRVWEQGEIVISNVTAATKIRFQKGKVGGARLCLDDIVISKVD